MHEIDLEDGAVLETHCVYVVPLLESAEFSFRVSGIANPKSSTGRLDVFTRLITDRAQAFDRIEPGYHGPLYAEISPRTFPVLVRKGSRLNQLRVRRGSPQFTDTQLKRLHAGAAAGRRDRRYRKRPCADRRPAGRWAAAGRLAGTPAHRHHRYRPAQRTRPAATTGSRSSASRTGAIVLDPDEFYILASPRGGVDPAGFCGRDGAVQSAGRRIPRALCGVLRSRLRP